MHKLSKIETIEYFACGFCINNEAFMFVKQPFKKKEFPAGVFLIKHKLYGYILYDTGYATTIMNTTIKYWFYRLLNPVVMSPTQTITQQLRSRGIDPCDIRYVILSHLHPDHIGEASQFSKAEFIVTKQVFDTYRRHRMKDLVFTEFLPTDFEQRVRVISTFKQQSLFPFTKTCDLFGDHSLLLASIDGHAKGQGCLFIPQYQLFLASDLTWGKSYQHQTHRMRKIAQLIQDDFIAYQKGAQLLTTIQENGIHIIVSHEEETHIKGILP